MIIIGCDFHPSWEQVAWLDTETGETAERRLVHAAGEAEPFYRQWPAPTLIGMESTGNCQWLIDLLTELGHEVWIGEAAQIRATMVRQQKTDRRDAAHLLELLVEGRFPPYLGAVERRTGSAAVVDSSLQAGDAASASEERAAAPGAEPGNAEEAQAVERGRTEAAARVAAEAVGEPTAGRSAEGAEHVGRTDQATG